MAPIVSTHHHGGPAVAPLETETKVFCTETPRYDVATFGGRLRQAFAMTDPLLLATSEEEIRRCVRLLEDWEAGRDAARRRPHEELWRARKVVESCTHPVTGETIFPLFRMGAIAPVNIPIVAGMLQTPPAALGTTIFWHWFNQSYNTACNVANANSRAPKVNELATAYGIAVTASCGIAVAAGRLVTHGPAVVRGLGPLIPFAAVAGANSANLLLSRMNEVRTGVPVVDEDGEVRGHSRAAGCQGVAQTALSRGCLMPAAAVGLPPATMALLRAAGGLPRNRYAALAVHLGVIYASVSVAVPAAMAVFPQTMTFAPGDLEKQFQGLRRKCGEPVRVLSANKGL